jgi:hypothetical protein
VATELPVPTQEDLEWLRRGWSAKELPVVIARPSRRKPFVGEVIAAHDVEGERWLVRAYLEGPDDGPMVLARIGVEHFGQVDKKGRSDTSPHERLEVTSTVMRGIPFHSIREVARFRLAAGSALIKAKKMMGVEPALSEWRGVRAAERAARRPHLRRTRDGYPSDFYREVARVLIELSKRGGSALEAFRTEFPKLHPNLQLPREIPLSTVKGWRKAAAEAGYLEKGSQGRPGFRPGPKLQDGKRPLQTKSTVLPAGWWAPIEEEDQ